MLITTAGLANADSNTATTTLPQLLRQSNQWQTPAPTCRQLRANHKPALLGDILSEWSPLLCLVKLRAFCRRSKFEQSTNSGVRSLLHQAPPQFGFRVLWPFSHNSDGQTDCNMEIVNIVEKVMT